MSGYCSYCGATGGCDCFSPPNALLPTEEQRDAARHKCIRAMHLWDEGDHATLFNDGWREAITAMRALAK